MKSRSLPVAVAAAVVFFLSATVLLAAAAVVEHTFVVSQMNMTHLCKETLVTVVNGQLPGPTVEVTEGDSVAVHVVNKSPNNITIHWHGVKQRLNCWADGVPMITQCPILPNHNFTYRFDVTGQEGTLWWHAHVSSLRATLHGAFIIRPRHGASSYPFPKPHREIPIIIGEWWGLDLAQVARDMALNIFTDYSSASTINGKLGDLFNCSGIAEDGYVLDVEPGKIYLLRVINAALFSEYYLKIAGHKFTVVAADANYVTPYTTDVIAIAPGETVDALVVADAPPGRYYMVTKPNQAPLPDTQTPEYTTRGMVQYSSSHSPRNGIATQRSSRRSWDMPVAPEMPDQHDTITSFYFHANLTSLRHMRLTPVPTRVDERLFITLGLGSICRRGQFCKRGESNETILVATMNNVSFQLPAMTTPLLEAHYYHTDGMGTLQELPNRPPRAFNFTDPALIPFGPKEERLEPTSKATVVRRFRHGATVEMVFQSTGILQGDSNPMHLHGHDMFVLAQGLGNYDAAKDVAKYNIVNPPVKNTVVVPNLGWAAVRFVADNPGVWYMHCHYEFHLAMGMMAVFIVEDGSTVDTTLSPPPMDFPTCGHDSNLMPNELYLRTKKSEVSRVMESKS
ncbi:laccase-15-like isoform X2 [Phragmites australis]|uniref:laccase-15-like isoform X2 n=1 Tax=Phragmites australis TaxID=29695 RepID=UPI002D76AC6C|nr:laccase-15-like isoform X2 [Phragmites australis]